MSYLLYGANGYTAQLIIKEGLKIGLKPVLAGRNEQKIAKIAKQFELEYKVFPLDDLKEVERNIRGFKLCLNAAGPFTQTAKPLALGCINTGVHYLDITGEIEVFEGLKAFDQKAQEKNVMIMPGVGFDVVPTDCMANYLKDKMPDATHLDLGFTSIGGALSHGTATTMVQNLGEKAVARQNGKLKKVNVAYKAKRMNFGSFSRNMATIPWGDNSTAYTSTGIPNIDTYTSIPRSTVRIMKFQSLYNPILKTGFVKKMAQNYIDKNLFGPNEETNKKGRSYIIGNISNGTEEKEAVLECAEGYLLTALTSIDIAQKVISGNLKAGYQTPAQAYGWNLIFEIAGSKFIKEA